MFPAVKFFGLCIAVFTLCFIAQGCSTTRINPYLSQATDTSLSKKEFLALEKSAKVQWEHRQDLNQLKLFIQTEEKIVRSSHATQQNAQLLSRAYFLMADGFQTSPLESLNQGSNWAEFALTHNPAFKQKLLVEKIPADASLATLTKKDAESLFWLATNLRAWAKLSGLSTYLKYKDRVKRMMDRVEELNPHIFYGGVYRYYGSHYANLPGTVNEDIQQSEKNFKKAFKLAPDFFGTHVDYAESLAVKKNDLDSFQSHLNLVIQGNAGKIKEILPEQILEQEKAKKLLARSSELF